MAGKMLIREELTRRPVGRMRVESIEYGVLSMGGEASFRVAGGSLGWRVAGSESPALPARRSREGAWGHADRGRTKRPG